jgi:hypothetical protein
MAFIVGGLIIGAGASIVGGAISAGGARDAANTAAAGSERDIAFQRESRDLARGDQAPYREAGNTALDALMSMTGLGGGAMQNPSEQRAPGSRRISGGDYTRGWGGSSGQPRRMSRYAGGDVSSDQMYNINEMGPENVYSGGAMTRHPNPQTIQGRDGYVQPNIKGLARGGPMQNEPVQNRGTGGVQENPGGVEGGYNFMTDPGYEFRKDEGMRTLERSAAANGGLLSGGFARRAMRYGQDYASNEYSNVYNRISNIAGLGQVSAGQSGGFAMQAGAGMGNAASNGANATAYGQVGASNAWANAGNNIAQLPWDNIGGGGSNDPVQYPTRRP